ncbi:hypothetical protein Acr_15g0015530 [Actinidia rufa]|uniref:Disease resistance N-terminal domain-containing protein n=1 Tax=Actinidia rufa TaxID=165716 RepID=A0A7J0FW79_9ERIC|nr:hypothetical protein Acr_15g0015530 [Actinidia rufa]
MAETAVNLVIDRLVPLLEEEAKLLRGVHREANSIIAELQVIKPFLRTADERADRGELDEGVKTWVKQVRQVSHQIEDVIDEYMLHLAKRHQRRGFIGFFYKIENPGFESFDELVTRRLSIHNSEDKVMESVIGSRIRSVLCFNADELPESFVGILFSNFKLLKILDFEDAPLHYLPGEVGDLFHLRLHKLRHLLIYYLDEKIESRFGSRQGVKIHEGFGRLEALQKLYFVEANHGPSSFEELRKLRQLRKLGIKKLKSEDGRALCTVIEKMNHLESLDVYSITNDEILDLQHIAFPPQFLRHLGLIGGYDGEVLHFKEGGFQKLKVLELRYLNALNTVIIDNGALANLQELEIGRTPQLKEVPSGIQHLRKLTNLTFYDVTDEFERTMLPNKGQDYKVVEHVPTVLFRFKRGPGQFDTYAL